MSSIEDQISAIEDEYLTAYRQLSKTVEYAERTRHYAGETNYATMPYVTSTLKTIVSFQRKLELLYEDTNKLRDDKTKFYIDRCEQNLDTIRKLLQGDYYNVDIVRRFRAGLSKRGAYELIDSKNYGDASSKVLTVRSLMYEIFEDVRLVYALRIYPIEEKIALKSMLTDFQFIDVVKCLDDADVNLADKHFKDNIDRLREALEKTVSSILVSEGKTPSPSFSANIGTLSGLGIINKEIKRLVEATYSYLSEVGVHGRTKKPTLGDANYSMKETYMRIDILLKKYRKYTKKQDKETKSAKQV